MTDLYFADLCKLGGRSENQDYLQARPLSSLSQFIVADGLGGQGGGALASKMATKKALISQENAKPDSVDWGEFFSPSWLEVTFEKAHDHIKELQKSGKQEFAHMATTMVVLMIMDRKAIWGHVGDSRLYMFRAGQIYHQTKDHSVPQMLVSSGEIEPEEMRNHPDRNRLLRALGDNRRATQARVCEEIDLWEGDAFLLCTDGFWEYVLEEEMLESLYQASSPKDWVTRMEQQYLLPQVEKERVLEGQIKAENDNYTALAVWYGDKPSEYISGSFKSSLFNRIKEKTKEVWEDFQGFKQHTLENKTNNVRPESPNSCNDDQLITNKTKEKDVKQRIDQKLDKLFFDDGSKTFEQNRNEELEKKKIAQDLDKTLKAIRVDCLGKKR